MSLGPQTRSILTGLGMNQADLLLIEQGKVSWDLLSDAESGEDQTDLVLFYDEGHRRIGRLTPSQVVDLINASEFESREKSDRSQSIAFPPGNYDDWAGVRPNSNWDHLVQAYRRAAAILATSHSLHLTEPWLFLCRHTLELQLKAIIMLGQEWLGLDADLPGHHDLQRLWTGAFPIASLQKSHSKAKSQAVRELVQAYHDADPLSFSFRYPVSKSNAPVDHAPFLQRFSIAQHRAMFDSACDYLDTLIKELGQRVSFSWLFGPKT